MSTIDFFVRYTPDNMTLDQFTKTCIESMTFHEVPEGKAVFHFGNKYLFI